MKRLLPLLLLFGHFVANSADVNAVAPVKDCFLCSSAPSMTMHFQSEKPKALMIVIPGGDGYIGITPDRTDLKHYWSVAIKRLTKSEFSRGQVDIVMMDSPRPLSSNDRDLGGRATSDHLIRIESVIRYYKEKTGLPIFVMGHSNGGPSIANFIKYQADNNLDLIVGVIASTTRHETNFPKDTKVPVVFITNRRDGCRNLSQLESLFSDLKETNSATTEWVVIENGEEEPGKHPCYSGYHMFYHASEEYANSIDTFIDNVLSSK
jgi:hypothetical protein